MNDDNNFDNNFELNIGEDNGQNGGKKKVLIIVISLLLIAIAAATFYLLKIKGKETKPTVSEGTKSPEVKVEEPAPEATLAAVDDSVPEGMARSRLTGEIIDASLAAKRPYAVMLNNIKVASPQSGISEADILFECVVEGGITRCMGIFQQISTDRLGSLRSARPYYVSFARDFDALYIHVGGSDDAKAKIKDLEIADLDGNGAIGTTLMYRDSNIKAPHNAFTSKAKIDKAVASKGFRTDYQGKAQNYFTFNKEAVTPEGTDAGKVTIKFSSYTTPYLTYNATDGMYYRFQFGGEHKDYNTKEQLKFKNIVIMYVKQWSYDGADRQEMDIYNSTGSGKYISNGKAVDITWKRNEADTSMQFLDASGNLLSINTGKTYIAVVPDTMASSTAITAQ